MKKEKATIANQINKEIPNPTLRWVFQCFEGINLLQQGDKISLDGFDELREKIIRLIGGHALHLYKIQKVAQGSDQCLLYQLSDIIELDGALVAVEKKASEIVVKQENNVLIASESKDKKRVCRYRNSHFSINEFDKKLKLNIIDQTQNYDARVTLIYLVNEDQREQPEVILNYVLLGTFNGVSRKHLQ